MNQTIKHIAIIMDGNRRWSKEHKLSLDYNVGFKKFEEIGKFILEQDIDNFSVYAFSKDNYHNRENQELEMIFNIINNIENIKIDFNIHFVGDIDELPENTKNKINKWPKSNYSKNLFIFFNYSFDWELEQLVNGTNPTKHIPQFDLLIRTGNRKRISNFALTLMKYTEIYFSTTMWPDFSTRELSEILLDYKKNRECKFGK